MEIKIQILGRVFSLCIGYKLKWFAQMPLVSLTEEFYDDGYGVTFAKALGDTLKSKPEIPTGF